MKEKLKRYRKAHIPLPTLGFQQWSNDRNDGMDRYRLTLEIDTGISGAYQVPYP